MSEERSSVVTLKGNPLTLVGPEINVGDTAPDFNSVFNLAEPASLESFSGKIKVFNVVLSVDTPVCDTQCRRFNSEALNLPDDVEFITVSMDLPFTQKRHSNESNLEKVKTVSDYKSGSFGEAYGVLIKEHELLARSIFVVDKENIVRYAEYVSEIAEEPNYDAALEVIKGLV